MRRKITAMILALAILASLTVAVAQSEADAKYSSTESGYISSWDEVDIHSFTVPYTGRVTVRVSSEKNHSTGMGYQFVLYSDSESYVTKKIYLKTSSQEFASEVLPAGTYYISVKYGASSLTFQTVYKDTKYYIDWQFYCSHKNQTSTEITAATCSEEGSVEARCDDCKEVVTTKATDKLPHTPTGEWVIIKATTCSEEGRRIQKCSVCGEDALVEEIGKLSHTAEWKTTKEATCSSEGQQQSICSVCKQVVETKRVIPLPHSYGSWQTDDEGTCRVDGQQSRICTVCKHKDIQSIGRGEHEYGEWSTRRKPTCSEEGIRVRNCTVCRNEDTESIPKLEHQYGEWKVTHEATCSKEGAQNRVCELCRKKEEQRIDRLEHTWYNKTVAVIDGNETYIPTCSVCGTSGSSVGITVEKEDENKKEVTVTKANSTTPTVIVIIMPSFQDVTGGSWYQSVVSYAYNLGLMVGTSDTSFNPTGNMTLAEAVTMAARARNGYEGGKNEDFKASSPWYQTYVDYAMEKGIVKAGDFTDYTRTATRAEMAYLFANALPEEGMKAINTVETLPDVTESDLYGAEIFKLYRAGVLTGGDAQGTFSPESPITRAEAAAIITRITLTSERKALDF